MGNLNETESINENEIVNAIENSAHTDFNKFVALIPENYYKEFMKSDKLNASIIETANKFKHSITEEDKIFLDNYCMRHTLCLSKLESYLDKKQLKHLKNNNYKYYSIIKVIEDILIDKQHDNFIINYYKELQNHILHIKILLHFIGEEECKALIRYNFDTDIVLDYLENFLSHYILYGNWEIIMFLLIYREEIFSERYYCSKLDIKYITNRIEIINSLEEGNKNKEFLEKLIQSHAKSLYKETKETNEIIKIYCTLNSKKIKYNNIDKIGEGIIYNNELVITPNKYVYPLNPKCKQVGEPAYRDKYEDPESLNIFGDISEIRKLSIKSNPFPYVDIYNKYPIVVGGVGNRIYGEFVKLKNINVNSLIFETFTFKLSVKEIKLFERQLKKAYCLEIKN